MIDPVQPYIEKFIEAGADIVSVHPEAKDDTEACLNKIKSLNVKAGLAINPDTEWEVVKPFMDKLDLILVMSVCLLYTSPSPRDVEESRMPSSA